MLLLLPPPPTSAAAAAGTGPGSSTTCTRSCGNISIPYPFGIEPGCYVEDGFNLTCDARSHHRPPKLFIGDGTVQVLAISVPNATVRINSSRVVFTHHHHDGGGSGGLTATGTWGAGLPRDGPYFLSEVTNSVAVLGCGVRADVRGGRHDHLLGSCTAVCPLVAAPPPDDAGGEGGTDHVGSRTRSAAACTGVGCCQAKIVPITSFYTIQIHKFDGSSNDSDYSVYIVDGVFDDYASKGRPEALPAMLDWVINNSTCSTDASAPACRSEHSFCQNSTAVGHGGYLCHCSDGYRGNPYVPDGCQGTSSV